MLLGRRPGLLGGVGDGAGEHGHAVLLEQVSRLVLEEVHGWVRPRRRFVSSSTEPLWRPGAPALVLGRSLRARRNRIRLSRGL